MIKHVLIVAGGSGKRMGKEIPKQFLELNGIPVLIHTFNTFLSVKHKFKYTLVLPESNINEWRKICKKYNFTIAHEIVSGGKERFFSVKNGLESIRDEQGLIAVHDGVRPLVSKKTIDLCFREAKNNGCAIPCIHIPETIREISGSGSRTINRSNLRRIQTPQVFSLSLLKQSYQQKYKDTFTDDASVFESNGNKIFLVEGNEENIKITTPADLIIAEALIKKTAFNK